LPRRLQEPSFKLRRDFEGLVLLVAHAAEHVIRQLAGVGSDANSNFLPQKDNMGWSGWEKFRNLTPNDKTNLQQQE
jgi:hypothetical protein